MKYIFLSIILSISTVAFAQDSTAYQLQRSKINGLLDERSERFGQYNESLTLRTGIFGWQTKKDIKNSNEILRQVVLNDNKIFKELKVLLDYKDQEVQTVKTTVVTNTASVTAYKAAVKNLQEENHLLNSKLENYDHLTGKLYATVIIGFLAILLLLFYTLRYKRLLKNEKAGI